MNSDVTSPEQVQAAIAAAIELGPLRVAVCCAGVGWAARTLDKTGKPHDLELFKKVIGINLVGTFNVLRLAAAAMAQDRRPGDGERGVIVNTASVAAFDGQIGQVAYAASKGGVRRHDAARGARPRAGRHPRAAPSRPASSTRRCSARCPRRRAQALAADIPFPKRLGDPAEYAALVAAHRRERAT